MNSDNDSDSDSKSDNNSDLLTTTRKPTLGAKPTLGLGKGVYKQPPPNMKPFPTLSPDKMRQREIEQYYKNYDAMDGLVTAIVLGGFFAFVCLLVIYKTKCKPMW